MEKEKESKMSYIFLEKTVNYINDLMQDVIRNEGVDKEMANMYAQDRNDAMDVKALIISENYKLAVKKLERMDTYPRENLIYCLIADLGADKVKEKLGYYI